MHNQNDDIRTVISSYSRLLFRHAKTIEAKISSQQVRPEIKSLSFEDIFRATSNKFFKEHISLEELESWEDIDPTNISIKDNPELASIYVKETVQVALRNMGRAALISRAAYFVTFRS